MLLTMSTCNSLGKVPTSHVALEVALETKPNLLLLTEEARVSSRFLILKDVENHEETIGLRRFYDVLRLLDWRNRS